MKKVGVRLSASEALQWLTECDEKFCPPKWEKDRLEGYAEKLAANAFWIISEDIGHKKGFVAYYLNVENRFVYITIIAVAKDYRGKGLGKRLMNAVAESVSNDYDYIMLEVATNNRPAIGLYESLGFEKVEDRGEKMLMQAICHSYSVS